MPDNGYIKTLYSDKQKTSAVYPRTVLGAVTGLNGETLQEALDAKADADNVYTKTETDTLLNTKQDIIIRNLLNPTLQTTTLNGLTCTKNGDGTYTLNGTASARVILYLEQSITNTFGGKKIVGIPSNAPENVQIRVEKVSPYKELARDTGSGAIILNDSGEIVVYINVSAGVVADNVLIKPMITDDLSATYNDFVSYDNSFALRKEVASLTDNASLSILGYVAPIINNVSNTLSGDTFTQRIGRVDLGSLSWAKTGNHIFYKSGVASLIKPTETESIIPNVVCSKYTADTFSHAYNETNDKIVAVTNQSSGSSGNVSIVDSAYSDATSFTTAMRGIYLYYELATPITHSVLNNSEATIANEYKAGDVIQNPSFLVLPAVLTGSAKQIHISIPLPKSLKNINDFTIDILKIGFRTPTGGYLDADNYDYLANAESITKSIDKVTNTLKIRIAMANAYQTNNICIVGLASTNNFKITLI